MFAYEDPKTGTSFFRIPYSRSPPLCHDWDSGGCSFNRLAEGVLTFKNVGVLLFEVFGHLHGIGNCSHVDLTSSWFSGLNLGWEAYFPSKAKQERIEYWFADMVRREPEPEIFAIPMECNGRIRNRS
jgi:hypothetical protein